MGRPNRHLPPGYKITKELGEWYLIFNGTKLLKRILRKDAIYEMEIHQINRRKLERAGG